MFHSYAPWNCVLFEVYHSTFCMIATSNKINIDWCHFTVISLDDMETKLFSWGLLSIFVRCVWLATYMNKLLMHLHIFPSSISKSGCYNITEKLFFYFLNIFSVQILVFLHYYLKKIIHAKFFVLDLLSEIDWYISNYYIQNFHFGWQKKI